MKQPIFKEGYCYVLPQGDWVHPIAEYRHELIWYPERGMTLYEQHLYRPYVKSIVTECAWLIGLYDGSKVLHMDEDGSWRQANHQTYGASNNSLTLRLLEIQSTIAAIPLDGGESFRRHIAEFKKRVELAQKLYKTP